jgi:hypothetical protein
MRVLDDERGNLWTIVETRQHCVQEATEALFDIEVLNESLGKAPSIASAADTGC